jgi:hypothetical protein
MQETKSHVIMPALFALTKQGTKKGSEAKAAGPPWPNPSCRSALNIKSSIQRRRFWTSRCVFSLPPLRLSAGLLAGLCAALLVFVVITAPSLAASITSHAQESSSMAVASDRYFEFHSGFWINLHLFLYEEALTRKGARDIGREAEFTNDASISATLSGNDKTAWDAAVAYYQSNLIGYDLLTNDHLRIIKNTLENFENSSSLSLSHLDPGLIRVLDNAAPVYRAHWWTNHDNANRNWIASVMPLVDADGDTLTQDFANAFETPWPDSPLRVDVVAYANYSGGFTTLHPTRITISSLDPANQKLTGLEALFHEASHSMDEKVGNLMFGYFGEHQKSAPPDLLHSLLYFTAGYFVKQLHPDYITYADGNNLWQQVHWSVYRDALIKGWQPHLEGKTTVSAAMSAVVADVAASANR